MLGEQVYEDMDSVVIKSPIRQHIDGAKGVYKAYNIIEHKKISVGDFKKEALSERCCCCR
jgi:hypothetical protein